MATTCNAVKPHPLARSVGQVQTIMQSTFGNPEVRGRYTQWESDVPRYELESGKRLPDSVKQHCGERRQRCATTSLVAERPDHRQDCYNTAAAGAQQTTTDYHKRDGDRRLDQRGENKATWTDTMEEGKVQANHHRRGEPTTVRARAQRPPTPAISMAECHRDSAKTHDLVPRTLAAMAERPYTCTMCGRLVTRQTGADFQRHHSPYRMQNGTITGTAANRSTSTDKHGMRRQWAAMSNNARQRVINARQRTTMIPQRIMAHRTAKALHIRCLGQTRQAIRCCIWQHYCV